MSHRHRFLFESAIHLNKHPARAFRTFCAELKRINKARAEDRTPGNNASGETA